MDTKKTIHPNKKSNMVSKYYKGFLAGIKSNIYFTYLLLITIPLAFYMRFAFFSVPGSDDIAYAKNAFDIANGNFEIHAHPFSNRIGLIIPVAIVYKLFGVNEYTSIVYPFLCSIAHSILTFVSGTLFFNFRVGIFAMLLMLFLPLDIVYATLLMPDLPASTFISICSIIFLYCEKKYVKWENLLYFISGLSLGWAYLIKEDSLFFITFLIIYMIIFLFKRKAKFSWIYLMFGILVPIITECAYYFFKTGDVFYRIYGIETIHNVSVWSGISYHGYSLLKRMFFELLNVLLQNRLFSFYFFLVFACIVLFFLEKNKKGALWYFVLWFGIMFLNLNFCSTSLMSYNLLQVVDRYIYLLLYPAIILLAYYLDKFYELAENWQMQDARNLIVSLTIPLAITGIFNFIRFSLSDIFFMILVFGTICFIYLLPAMRYKQKKYVGWGIISLLVIANISPSIYMTVRHLIKKPYNEKYIFKLVKKLPNTIIYTDDRKKSILDYLDGFKNTLKIESFYDKNINEIENSYIIVDMDYLIFANKYYHKKIPLFAEHLPSHWKVLKRFNTQEGYGCVIYNARSVD